MDTVQPVVTIGFIQGTYGRAEFGALIFIVVALLILLIRRLTLRRNRKKRLAATTSYTDPYARPGSTNFDDTRTLEAAASVPLVPLPLQAVPQESAVVTTGVPPVPSRPSPGSNAPLPSFGGGSALSIPPSQPSIVTTGCTVSMGTNGRPPSPVHHSP